MIGLRGLQAAAMGMGIATTLCACDDATPTGLSGRWRAVDADQSVSEFYVSDGSIDGNPFRVVTWTSQGGVLLERMWNAGLGMDVYQFSRMNLENGSLTRAICGFTAGTPAARLLVQEALLDRSTFNRSPIELADFFRHYEPCQAEEDWVQLGKFTFSGAAAPPLTLGNPVAIIGVLPLALVYWLPSLVAWRRNKSRLARLFLLNTLFGWTLLAWVFLLGYSWASQARSGDAPPPNREPS